MKSLTAVCQTGASMPAINPNGRISRHPPHRGDGENAEMKMYLSKLKDLVPFMPKNRKLSKLEIIQHVIDYICDLQSELETHPEINNFDATAALTFAANSLERVTSAAANDDEDDEEMHGGEEEDEETAGVEVQERLNGSLSAQQQQQQQYHYQSSPAQRQPLVDRQTPNTILPPATQQRQLNASAAVAASLLQNHHHVPSSVAVSTAEAASITSQTATTHTLSGEKDMNSRQIC